MSERSAPWPTPPSHVPQAPARATPDEKPPPSATRNIVEWVVIIVGALVVAVVVKTFLIQAFYIPSGSMLPTLHEQDRVLVNKLSYDLHPVHRGDIIVFKGPQQAEGDVKDLIKRVVAIPGDTVEGHDGQVWVNGQAAKEPYLGAGVDTAPFDVQTIPKDHYWVMGDNRGNSKDSRVFGPIARSLIIGRAFVRVWPLGRFHFF